MLVGTSISYRNIGWEALSGKWGNAAMFTLVYLLIAVGLTTVESQIWEYSIISTLLLMPVQYGYVIAFLDSLRSGEDFNIKSLFGGYNDWSRITGTYLLVQIFTVLWMLLLIVPGIIKAISYSQTFYVLKDNPSLSYNAAIERSMEMMQGHKWEYFCLYFSFIGWILLVIISFGVASLWVSPYMSATFAHYYENLKAEYENNKTAA